MRGSQLLKRVKPILPVTKAIRYLTAKGILAGRVDRQLGMIAMDWPGGGQGFDDILAVFPDGPMLIQVTSDNGGNHAAHVRKLVEERTYAVQTCLRRGMRVEVWSWKPEDDEDCPPRKQAINLDML